MTAATAAYRWCSVYVDTPDQASVVVEMGRRLGAPSDLGVFTVQGFTVDVRRNPDRTESAHFLDWRTMVDVDADEHVPDHDVVRFVASLMTHLRSRGYRVAAECDFSAELPQADVR